MNAKMHRNPRGTCATHQRGVGLIEVLVAVLVVSIGFLGIAALQVFSLSTNNSAMARSLGTLSSYSIMDAMRTDRANVINGAYNKTVTASACPAAAGTLASSQLHTWCEQLGHNLGVAATTKGTINCTATGGNEDPWECVITISYDDSRSGAGGVDAQGVAKTVTETVVTRTAL